MSAETDSINLDDEFTDPADLRAWAVQRGTRRPRAVRLYALHKADAIEHRLAGRIGRARTCELMCEQLYGRIPEAWRW